MAETVPRKLGESHGPTKSASAVAVALVTGALCIGCARALIGRSKPRGTSSLARHVMLVLTAVLLSFGVAVSLPGHFPCHFPCLRSQVDPCAPSLFCKRMPAR